MECIAAHDYDPAGLEGCIALTAGETVVVSDGSRDDWWVGYTTANPSVAGHFPRLYVRPAAHNPQPELEPEPEPASGSLPEPSADGSWPPGRRPKPVQMEVSTSTPALTVAQALEELCMQLALGHGKPKDVVRAAAAQLGCELEPASSLKAHILQLCELLDITTNWDLSTPTSSPKARRSRSPTTPRGGFSHSKSPTARSSSGSGSPSSLSSRQGRRGIIRGASPYDFLFSKPVSPDRATRLFGSPDTITGAPSRPFAGLCEWCGVDPMVVEHGGSVCQRRDPTDTLVVLCQKCATRIDEAVTNLKEVAVASARRRREDSFVQLMLEAEEVRVRRLLQAEDSRIEEEEKKAAFAKKKAARIRAEKARRAKAQQRQKQEAARAKQAHEEERQALRGVHVGFGSEAERRRLVAATAKREKQRVEERANERARQKALKQEERELYHGSPDQRKKTAVAREDARVRREQQEIQAKQLRQEEVRIPERT